MTDPPGGTLIFVRRREKVGEVVRQGSDFRIPP
jgi:hypothetical protein